MRARMFHPCHYSLLEGHAGERRMYNVIRQSMYWPQIADNVYATVKDCLFCAQNRQTTRWQRKLRLFFPAGSLEFLAIDILGPLQQTMTDNRYIEVMTNRFPKLTKAITTSKITTIVLATIFIEHWVMNFGIPSTVFTGNGPQSRSKFSGTVLQELGWYQRTTTEYHPQANGQVARFNQMMI